MCVHVYVFCVGLTSWRVTAEEREKRREDEGGGSSVSPFTLQESSRKGAEGMQSLAPPV